MRDIEMILRFFALYENLYEYNKPMKEFLTNFMRNNKDLSKQKQQKYSSVFKETMDFIHKEIGPDAFKIRTGINVAVMDAISVSIARLDNKVLKEIGTKQRELFNDEDFIESVSVHTTDKDKVIGRVERAIEVFSS